jgi:4-hydroxy-tetrahydrodipicolinate synthase
MFQGVMTALVTPFKDERVDERALAELVEAQIAGGVDALVPCGTTGESATLSDDEQARVIRLVVDATKKRVPVIAGAGANATDKAVARSRAAKAAGADGLLQVTPYYNRPTQEGLYAHFRAIGEAVGLPTIVYNVPARTGCDLAVDTIARLCDLPSVVGVKDATGSVARGQQIVAKVGDRLRLYSGEDAVNYPLYCIGASGCISVISNAAPKLLADGWDAFAAGDFGTAQKLHYRMLALNDIIFVETNPIGVKAALALMGRISTEIRLPLVPMSGVHRERLRAVLAELGLL